MATTTGTNVKFVKVQTKQQYNDYTDKDGALIFVENERKIYVDGVAYGFSDSDVEGSFLELTGGVMSGNINMNDYSIGTLKSIIFKNGAAIQYSPNDVMNFHSGVNGEALLTLGVDNTNAIKFDATRITGIPTPTESSSPISKEYLETHVIDKIGADNGIAELDNSGKVPSSQLPSYVDDVLEYPERGSFPNTGETGKLYVAIDDGSLWRWSGSGYVQISAGSGALVLGETASTAYRGDRGKTAYDHSQIESGNPHKVTKSDVSLGSVQNYGVATQAEAESGTSSSKYMTPQRTKQAIEKLAPKLSWEVVS